MDVKDLLETPPWEWPRNAGQVLLETLSDKQADSDERVTAAELASELVVMNDEMADTLLAIVGNGDEPERLRATAAIGLGPVLEQGYIELVDNEGFDDPESVPISLDTFRNIQESLHKVYLDESNPKEVRRRILEGSVRCPEEWHVSAIKAAYSSGDKDWMLTAVFGMRTIRGFEDQILEALESADPEIHYEAVNAAGGWELNAAWPHIVALVKDPSTPKLLLLAAIEAVGTIRSQEAEAILLPLVESRDEDIVDAVHEAIAMAQAMSGEGDDEGIDDDGNWIN